MGESKMNPKINLKHSAVALALSQALYFPYSNAQDINDTAADVEVIQVKGIRSSLKAALQDKRAADSIQDGISAEDIGKFPDQNVAESLQRITGVSISRVNGEGSQVSVRSFGPEFNIVKLNDRTLATTGGGRSFDFQLLPSELIAGADVIKSPTADLSAGSIGAYVNVRTAKPFDNAGFNAVGSVKSNFHSLSEEASPEFAGIVSNTFADDTIGVLVGVSHKQSDGRIDSYRSSHWNQYSGNGDGLNTSLVGEDSRGPGRSIYNMVDEARERTGVNAVVQFELNENTVSTFDAFYSKLDREYLGSGLQVPNQTLNRYSEATISDAGTLLTATIVDTDVEMNVAYGLEEITTTAVGFNTVFEQDELTLEFDASYSKAEYVMEGDDTTALHHTRYTSTDDTQAWDSVLESVVTDPNGNVINSSIVMDYSTDIPSMTIEGMDVTDASKVRAAWQRYMAYESEDEVKELKLDAKYEIDSGVLQTVKAGVAYSAREIVSSTFGTEFNPESGGETWDGAGMWIGDGATWGPSGTVGVLPDSVFALSADNYMDGVSGDFPRQWVQIADHAAYRAATQAHLEELVAGGDDWRSSIVDAGWDTVYSSPGGSYSNEESQVDFYLQADFAGELGDYLWTGNVGARYVSIENTAKGRASTIDELSLAGTSPIQNTSSTSSVYSEVATDESHFLPSVNFMLDLDNGSIVRAAAANTITRPSLADAGVNLSESPGVDSPTVSISGGNPYLTSYEVTQFDLSYEYYEDNGNALSVTYFFKDISNFISTITTVGPWNGPIAPDLAAAYAVNNQVVTYNSNRKENRAGGTVQGLEFGALHNFDYLPGLLSGFGVQANYTYADSEDKDALPINLPLVQEPGNALEGFAKHSYNVIGFYDKDGLQARVAYNWRDNFLSSRSGDGIQPEYNDAYGQLDMSVSYDLSEMLTLSFEAVNLTNETRLQYYGQRDRVSFVEMTGTRYHLGLRASF